MARLKCPRGEKAVSVCVPESEPTRFAGHYFDREKRGTPLDGLGGMTCPHCGGWAEKHPAINAHVCTRCAAQRDEGTGQWHLVNPKWSADSREKVLPDVRNEYTLVNHGVMQSRERAKGTSHMGAVSGNTLTAPAILWSDKGAKQGGHWVMDMDRVTGSLSVSHGGVFALFSNGELLKSYASYADLMKHFDGSQFHTSDPGKFWGHTPSLQFENLGEVMGWFDSLMESGHIGRLR